MALPTSYTETTLAQYMISSLGAVAEYIDMTDVADYDEVVNDVMVFYGVTDMADATDIGRLRAIAALKAWEFAQGVVAADYNFSADGGKYDRSQVFDMIEKRIAALRNDASAFLGNNAATVVKFNHVNDPYRPQEWQGIGGIG